MEKAFYIVDDNGEIKDIIIGDDSKRQVAETTLDYILKTDDSWLKHRIVELEIEGYINKGHVNVLTTIKMNNIPIRAIVNDFKNITTIVESYMTLENDYRKYTFNTEYIKID